MSKVLLTVLGLLATQSAFANADWMNHLALKGQVTLFTGPSPTAHAPFIDLISTAQNSVLMEMFHLTDPQVADALGGAASRGISVTVILDGGSLKSGEEKQMSQSLQQKGVTPIASSPAFSITHSKSMVVDHERAIVSSMNLTDHPEVRRDYGVEINDPDVIREMETVFNADILNSQNQTGETPQVSDPHLLWSPINSNEKLHDLISSATTSIVAVAENVLDTSIVQDLIDAAARGVNVEVLSPACPLGGHPDGNYQTSLKLKAGGVSVRQMPDPATPTTPYLHGKMMVIDNARAYVGSINYSYNSMHRARELGIALEDRAVVKGLSDAFAADYQNALEVGKALPNCAK